MSNSRDELTGALIGLGATITEAMNEIRALSPVGTQRRSPTQVLLFLKTQRVKRS